LLVTKQPKATQTQEASETFSTSDPTAGLWADGDNQAFNTVLYTGDGESTHAITGVGFQPDLVWFKRRNEGASHILIDAVRGTNKRISSDQTDAESTAATYLTAFNTDGFTTGNNAHTNEDSDTYVAWNWKAGGEPTTDNVASAGATPTAGSVKINGSNLGSALAGSIAATRLSANTDAGFSIVSYTANGTSGATVGHGLSSVPEMIIVKRRTSAEDWGVGHTSLGWNKFIRLNTAAAAATATNLWDDTSPSSSLVTLGDSGIANNNSSTTHIMYCFHSVDGYSKGGFLYGQFKQ